MPFISTAKMSRNEFSSATIPGSLAKTFQAQDTLLPSRGEATERDALNAGAQCYLTKPYDFQRLINEAQRLISASGTNSPRYQPIVPR